MTRRRPPGVVGALAALVTSTLLAAGCGGQDEGAPIPGRDAQAMLVQLDQVTHRVEQGKCDSARFQVLELEQKVDRLPREVDPEVRRVLAREMDDLRALVDGQCQPPKPTPTTTPEPATPAPESDDDAGEGEDEEEGQDKEKDKEKEAKEEAKDQGEQGGETGAVPEMDGGSGGTGTGGGAAPPAGE